MENSCANPIEASLRSALKFPKLLFSEKFLGRYSDFIALWDETEVLISYLGEIDSSRLVQPLIFLYMEYVEY